MTIYANLPDGLNPLSLFDASFAACAQTAGNNVWTGTNQFGASYAPRLLNVGSGFVAAQPYMVNFGDNQAPADSRAMFFGFDDFTRPANGLWYTAAINNVATGGFAIPGGGALGVWASAVDIGIDNTPTPANNSYGHWFNHSVTKGTGAGGIAVLIQGYARAGFTPGGLGTSNSGVGGLQCNAWSDVGGYSFAGVFGVITTVSGSQNVGIEIDNDIRANTAGDQIGIQVVSQNGSGAGTPTVAGANVGYYLLKSSGPGYKNAIQIGNSNGTGFPLLATGAILQAFSASTITTGIDISSLTITGNAFASKNFTVSGAGLVTAPTFNATSTTTGYQISGVQILNTSANYTELYDPTGAQGILIGATGSDTANYYYASNHHFRTRGGVDKATLNMGATSTLDMLGGNVITPSVVGGTAANSTLTLQSTNNGTPSGDSVTVQTGFTSAVFPSQSNIVHTVDGANSGLTGFSYGSGATVFPSFSGRRARGTLALPTQVVSGDIVMRFGAASYFQGGTSGFPGGNKATFEIIAAETQTDLAQGHYARILTTAIGTNTPLVEVIRFQPGGGVSIGNTVQGAIGGLNVTGKVGIGTETNPQVPFVVSANSATGLNSAATAPTFLIIGADGGSTNLASLCFGAGNGGFVGVTAGGTGASPSATPAATRLMSLGGSGWANGAFTTGKALISLDSVSLWSATDNSAQITFATTAVGATTRVEAARFSSSGGLSIGTTTDVGTGNLLVQNFINTGGYVRQGGDLAISSNTTPQPSLTVTVVAGKTYGFDAYLPFTDAAAGGVQCTINGSCTATALVCDGYLLDSNTVKAMGHATVLGAALVSTTTTATTGLVVRIHGTITVNAGGVFGVFFAQNTSNATATTLKAGAWCNFWLIT